MEYYSKIYSKLILSIKIVSINKIKKLYYKNKMIIKYNISN